MKDSGIDEFVERVRAESDIINVISGYVPLKKRGKDYWGCCPFHSEKTPSFSVAPDKGFFYCFGCQSGGNVFNFLMKIENITFFEAVKLLAERMNIPLPERHKSEDELDRERELARLYRINDMAKDFFYACLAKTSYGQKPLEYLLARGISREIIEAFHIGYAPPIWDKLFSSFSERGVSGEALIKAGLIVKKTSGDGYYDRFRDRIMFPIQDLRGRVVGFGGRVTDDSQPKYLNSPETPVFNKRHILYGLDKAYSVIKATGKVIIVEGYMDVIALHHAGITNSVASLGTAFSVEQARHLRNFADEFLFAYDSDMAGQNATLRALGMVKAMGIPVKVIAVPDGKDPDEFIRNHGAQAFRELVDQALPLVDYQICHAIESSDITALEGKVTVISKIVPALAEIENAVEVNYYITYLAKTLAIDENAIYSEYSKYRKINKKDKNVNNGQNILYRGKNKLNSAATQAERQIIRLMLEDVGLIPYVQAQMPEEYIGDIYRREIIHFVFTAYNREKSVQVSVLPGILSEMAKDELALMMMMNFESSEITRVVDDCLKTIHVAHLQLLYEQHRLRADELERLGDSGYLQELAESQRIKNEIKKMYGM